MSAPAITAILFDKDGTLIDFERTWIPAYHEAAQMVERHAGRPGLAKWLLADGGFDAATGRVDPTAPLAAAASEAIARDWAERAIAEDTAVLTQTVLDIFAAHSADPVPITPLMPLFARFKARGIFLGLATMDREAPARSFAAAAGGNRLDFLCGADSGLAGKPAPDMALAFCSAVDVAPDRLAVVGDTPHDMAMARAAGARLAIGVRTGAAGSTGLDHCADFVIDSVAQLDRALKSRGLVAEQHVV
jgi:phosphoglycolate phosphatase